MSCAEANMFALNGAVAIADVLSWRWDCEETAQIWQNCADLIIEA